MFSSRIHAGIAAAAAAALLAGCQSAPRGPAPGGPIAAAPQGIEGAWIDGTGAGLTTFAAGRFETIATDSQQKLSEGTYTMRTPTLVEISGISIIRQSPIAFNCALATPSQLNCTASGGQQFVMTRRVGAV